MQHATREGIRALRADRRRHLQGVDDRRGWDLSSLVALATVTAAAALAGSLASGQSGTFYAQLEKPSWAPPAQVFAPVWTTLYVLMTVAVWLGVREWGWKHSQGLIGLYVAQLLANTLWSILFFGRRMGGAALVDAVLLWLLVGTLATALWGLRRQAAILLVPYWLWVTFAVALNYSVWRSNPTLL